VPRVSICIPTYNRANIIAATVDTILAQSYTDFELVVVDNCSTDGTQEIINGIKDSRLRFVRNEYNCGLILNQNRAIEEGQGEFIAVLHDHDFYHPDLVKRSVDILDGNPGVGVVCSGMHLVDPDQPERIIRTDIQPWAPVMSGKEMRRIMMREWNSPIAAPTAMVRRRCYEEAGTFIAEYGGAADRELWLRIFRKWDCAYIAEPLAKLRDRYIISSYNKTQSVEFWKQMKGQITIQEVHMPYQYGNAPVKVAWERTKLRMKTFMQFWRWGLWGLASNENVFVREAADAFTEVGMRGSARLLMSLQSSALASRALANVRRLYRASRA
jgi:glycosyltransferase involved in cell wall biosynthesis